MSAHPPRPEMSTAAKVWAEGYDAVVRAPVGVEAVDAAAWTEALELPEGFRVAEHLPGIWEYQFDIADADDEDSDRKVSGASWNHPALAAIAAWQHVYDEALAQQPAAVDEALIQTLRSYLEDINKDDGENYLNLSCDALDIIDAALAAQQGGRDDD